LKEESNVTKYLNLVSNEMGLLSPGDWYNLPKKFLQNTLKGRTLLRNSYGLTYLLKKHYQLNSWKNRERKSPSKIQITLFNFIQQMFKEYEVILDYIHPLLKFSQSGKKMPLDIFIPSLALAIEYQGEQHYKANYLFGNHFSQQERDLEKHKACINIGITLIIVPYWWDLKVSKVSDAIYKHRPDIIRTKR